MFLKLIPPVLPNTHQELFIFLLLIRNFYKTGKLWVRESAAQADTENLWKTRSINTALVLLQHRKVTVMPCKHGDAQLTISHYLSMSGCWLVSAQLVHSSAFAAEVPYPSLYICRWLGSAVPKMKGRLDSTTIQWVQIHFSHFHPILFSNNCWTCFFQHCLCCAGGLSLLDQLYGKDPIWHPFTLWDRAEKCHITSSNHSNKQCNDTQRNEFQIFFSCNVEEAYLQETSLFLLQLTVVITQDGYAVLCFL